MTENGIQARAGWNGASLRTPGAQARFAQLEAEEARERAQAERDAEFRRQDHYEANVALSIAMAQERGEVFSLREAMRGGGVGRTRAEAMAYAFARQEVADAAAGRVLRKMGIDPEEAYGDASAPFMTAEQREKHSRAMAFADGVLAEQKDRKRLEATIRKVAEPLAVGWAHRAVNAFEDRVTGRRGNR